ncbi:YesL family protein [Cellulomonas algicola]|uniref:YesL family protein n=2 Tax=Cellulomonas algicola TaxID=2071633 RepID=UPI00366B75CE
MTAVPVDDRDAEARRALTARPRGDDARTTGTAADPVDPAGRSAGSTDGSSGGSTERATDGSSHGSTSGSTDGEVGGWAGRVMGVLRVATHVVGVNALVLLGTLAGLVVLGLLPALVAGGRLLARLADGHPSDHLWHDFWSAYRSGWRRTNLLGAPVWPVGALLSVDAAVVRFVDGPLAAVLAAGVLALGAWFCVALLTLVAVARRYDETLPRTWRFAALFPLLSPGTSLAVLVVVAACTVSVLALPVLAPLVGIALPLLAGGWLVDRRLGALDARGA